MKHIMLKTLAAVAVLAFAPIAQAQDAASLSELLKLIEQGQVRDTAEARQREAEVNARKADQTNLLNAAKAERGYLRTKKRTLFGDTTLSGFSQSDRFPFGSFRPR